MIIMLGSSYAIHGGTELSMRSASGIQGARHMYMYIPLAMSHHVMRKLERNYLTGGCYFQRDEERG